MSPRQLLPNHLKPDLLTVDPSTAVGVPAIGALLNSYHRLFVVDSKARGNITRFLNHSHASEPPIGLSLPRPCAGQAIPASSPGVHCTQYPCYDGVPQRPLTQCTPGRLKPFPRSSHPHPPTHPGNIDVIPVCCHKEHTWLYYAIAFFAKTELPAGSELTINYGHSYLDSLGLRCRCAPCLEREARLQRLQPPQAALGPPPVGVSPPSASAQPSALLGNAGSLVAQPRALAGSNPSAVFGSNDTDAPPPSAKVRRQSMATPPTAAAAGAAPAVAAELPIGSGTPHQPKTAADGFRPFSALTSPGQAGGTPGRPAAIPGGQQSPGLPSSRPPPRSPLDGIKARVGWPGASQELPPQDCGAAAVAAAGPLWGADPIPTSVSGEPVPLSHPAAPAPPRPKRALQLGEQTVQSPSPPPKRPAAERLALKIPHASKPPIAPENSRVVWPAPPELNIKKFLPGGGRLKSAPPRATMDAPERTAAAAPPASQPMPGPPTQRSEGPPHP